MHSRTIIALGVCVLSLVHGFASTQQLAPFDTLRNGSDQRSAIVTIADGAVWSITATGDGAKAKLAAALKLVNIGALTGDHEE